MTEVVNFLNSNQGALSVVFSFVVMVATAIYAWLTWSLVSETRRMRRLQSEPQIDAVIESTDVAIHLMRLRVRNIGLGAARNLRFALTPISSDRSGQGATALVRDFTGTSFLLSGLGYLGPGESRYSGFTSVLEDTEEKLSATMSLKVEYGSWSGERHTAEYTLDMSERKGDYQLGTPPLQTIAKNVEEFRKAFDSVSGGFKRLNVNFFSAEDRSDEKERTLESMGRGSRRRKLKSSRLNRSQ